MDYGIPLGALPVYPLVVEMIDEGDDDGPSESGDNSDDAPSELTEKTAWVFIDEVRIHERGYQSWCWRDDERFDVVAKGRASSRFCECARRRGELAEARSAGSVECCGGGDSCRG